MKQKAKDKREECSIWGRHAVLSALRAHKRPLYRLFFMEGTGGKAVESIRREAERRAVQIETISRHVLEDQVGKNAVHQGVVLQCGPLPQPGWKTVLSRLRGKSEAAVVFSDRLEDPRNLGSLIRTAGAFGVEAVIVSKARSAPLDARAVKASTGEIEKIDLLQVNNFSGVLKAFQNAGFWLIGLEVSGSKPLWDTDLSMPFIGFIVGGEGTGVRRSVLHAADFTACIPMSREKYSLNVSVALGMGLYEWRRQKARRR